MRAFACAVTLTFAAAVAAAQSDTSALVDASKEAKAKRRSSTTKVITNADVKKSKGKLVERPATPADAVESAPQPDMVATHEAARAARIAAEEARAATEKLVAGLERELAKIEQAYYEENDLDRRDSVIARQFAETKKKLDDARKALGGEMPPDQPAGTPAHQQ